jgi:hypothetical protein
MQAFDFIEPDQLIQGPEAPIAGADQEAPGRWFCFPVIFHNGVCLDMGKNPTMLRIMDKFISVSQGNVLPSFSCRRALWAGLGQFGA